MIKDLLAHEFMNKSKRIPTVIFAYSFRDNQSEQLWKLDAQISDQSRRRPF